MLVHHGEGLGTPTEPYHTPSPEIVDFVEASHLRYALTINLTVYVSHIRQFWSTAMIETTDEGTKILATVDDEPASPIGDDSQGKACPTDSGLEAEHDRANITKTSTMPSDSTQGQQDKMALKITAQDLEISALKAIIKHLDDRDRGDDNPSGEDATIKGRRLESGEEVGIERSIKKGSNDIEEMVNVLTSLDVASVLSSGVQVSVPPAAEFATVSIPPAGEIPTISVPTGSGMVPTTSSIFFTATVATPYSRRKGKEKMVESDTPKKKKLQEQIDVQVAREMEEQLAREDQRRDERIARDVKIVRIHAEEELQMMIDGLDMSNELIAKHLQEYELTSTELTIEEKIELINELVKYQDHLASILKYKSQQSKPLSKKQQREFYMSVLRSHAGWKTKHFKGMSLEEIREKFDLVWKQIQDFIPMGSKEEGERFKRKWISLEQDSAKKVKISEEVPEEDLKAMMQLVPVEEVYVEALQKIDCRWSIKFRGGMLGIKCLRHSHYQKKFPLLVKKVPLLKKRDATAKKIALLMKTRVNHGQRYIYKIQRRVSVTQLSLEIKKTNDVVRLQALIDRRKCRSAKRTAWNEFSSSMASAVICLATANSNVEDAAKDEDADNGVSIEPTPPSPTPEDASKQGGITELDADEDVTLEEVDDEVAIDDTDEAEPAKVEEVIEVVIAAKLMTEVVITAATPITVAQVPKASALRRRRGVIIQDLEETATASVIMHSEGKSKDKGNGILIEEPKSLKRQAHIEQDEAFTRELEAKLNANIISNDVMEQVKRKEKKDNTVMRY
nr:hypothetical protein [Tanacetum cinerariifolium]